MISLLQRGQQRLRAEPAVVVGLTLGKAASAFPDGARRDQLPLVHQRICEGPSLGEYVW